MLQSLDNCNMLCWWEDELEIKQLKSERKLWQLELELELRELLLEDIELDEQL